MTCAATSLQGWSPMGASQEIKLHVVDVHKVPKCFVQSLRRGIDAVIVYHCL